MNETASVEISPDTEILWTSNGRAVRLQEIPTLSIASFRTQCIFRCSAGSRLIGLIVPGGQQNELLAVIADDRERRIGLLRTVIADHSYPSFSVELPQAQAFERENYENHGVEPEGHPWLKPLRRHGEPPHPFFQVEGTGIHEVAVGPVHAGIIEPGHFRFQCHGEVVEHLEIQLGYQHRGAEALLLRSSPARRLIVAESIAGDTVIGHAWAHCQALEALADVEPPATAQAHRGIALELERLANHVGDLGALCNDVGYLPGASWFGRLRGEFLNLLMEMSGNRFGRGLVVPGGVRFALEEAERASFMARLEPVEHDVRGTADLVFESASIVSRFEQTGVLPRESAQALGLVGPAARASGCDRDVRRDHPFGVWRSEAIPVCSLGSGDVMARAEIRWLEIQRSLAFVRGQLQKLRDEPSAVPRVSLRSNLLVVSMVEGWRGEIVHIASTDAAGALATYKIVDPSFHNWMGLAMALRGQQISDFPLCNKSFNLSYAGHDL